LKPVINVLDWELLITSLNVILLVITLAYSVYYLMCFNKLLTIRDEGNDIYSPNETPPAGDYVQDPESYYHMELLEGFLPATTSGRI